MIRTGTVQQVDYKGNFTTGKGLLITKFDVVIDGESGEFAVFGDTKAPKLNDTITYLTKTGEQYGVQFSFAKGSTAPKPRTEDISGKEDLLKKTALGYAVTLLSGKGKAKDAIEAAKLFEIYLRNIPIKLEKNLVESKVIKPEVDVLPFDEVNI